MNKGRKLAVAVLAVVGLSGCASTQVAGPDRASAGPVEQSVSRALSSYGTLGGYRYRRFAAAVKAT
jgi:outer membrane lipoprotein SlyB